MIIILAVSWQANENIEHIRNTNLQGHDVISVEEEGTAQANLIWLPLCSVIN